MKKIIFNNLFKDILVFFAITSSTLTLIVWILQAVNFLDIVSEDGHSISTYFSYSILNIPKIFNKLLLLSYFISIFYILTLYEDKNQILIFWINGVSKISFLNKIIFFSIFFSIFSFCLSYFIVPYTQDQARSFIRTSNLDFFPSLIKPRKFIDTVENFTIFLDGKKSNSMEKILIKDSSTEGNSQIIISKGGKILDFNDEKFLSLKNGVIINSSNNNNITSFNFDETTINLGKYKTKTTITPKIQEIKSKNLIKCYKHLISKNENKLNNIEINCDQSFLKNITQELYKRIFLPIYIPIISIGACFLILKSSSNLNYKMFRIKVFLSGILLITFSQISMNTINLSFYSSIFTLLFPLLLFLITYIIFFKKMVNSS